MRDLSSLAIRPKGEAKQWRPETTERPVRLDGTYRPIYNNTNVQTFKWLVA
jgi:hypothetical protein